MRTHREEERLQEIRFYQNVVVGGISLYSLTQMCKYQMECFRKKRAIIQAEKAKVYTPDQLLKKIKDRTSNLQDLSKLSGFEYSNEQHTEIKGRVFLNGLVKCDKPLYADSTFVGDFRMKGLIYKIKYDEEKYSLDAVNSSKSEYRFRGFPDNAVFSNVKEFKIQDQYSTTTCDVPFSENLDVTRALQIIGQRDKLISVSILQRLLGVFIMLIKLLVDLLSGRESPFSRSVRGIRLGITEKEIGIKIDSIINVYGQIFFNLETGKIRFEVPDVLVNDKNQFMYKLKESLLESRFYRNVFGIVFSATVVYFARRAFLYWRKNPDFNLFDVFKRNEGSKEQQQKL